MQRCKFAILHKLPFHREIVFFQPDTVVYANCSRLSRKMFMRNLHGKLHIGLTVFDFYVAKCLHFNNNFDVYIYTSVTV